MEQYNLNRFLEAQDKGLFEFVVDELRTGKKRTHWMWFIFPQLKNLGQSPKAKFFGISDAEEARAFMANDVLSRRLREVSEIVLSLPEDNPEEIFGWLDSLKLKSCMTLFDYVMPNDVFDKVLNKLYGGERDQLTLKYLKEKDNMWDLLQ